MNHSERSRIFDQNMVSLLDRLYRTALRMTRDSATAEDLVQDTCLKVFNNLHRFEPDTNFRAWVFRILMNNFINDFHRKKLMPRPVDLTGLCVPDRDREPHYFTTEELSRFREEIGDVAAKALDGIPTHFRSVFLLSTLEGFSYRQMSRILEIPIGTVMSRLFRARRMLRQELAVYARDKGFLRGPEIEEERISTGKTASAKSPR